MSQTDSTMSCMILYDDPTQPDDTLTCTLHVSERDPVVVAVGNALLLRYTVVGITCRAKVYTFLENRSSYERTSYLPRYPARGVRRD